MCNDDEHGRIAGVEVWGKNGGARDRGEYMEGAKKHLKKEEEYRGFTQRRC